VGDRAWAAMSLSVVPMLRLAAVVWIVGRNRGADAQTDPRSLKAGFKPLAEFLEFIYDVSPVTTYLEKKV
jgi:hypothetical protein